MTEDKTLSWYWCRCENNHFFAFALPPLPVPEWAEQMKNAKCPLCECKTVYLRGLVRDREEAMQYETTLDGGHRR